MSITQIGLKFAFGGTFCLPWLRANYFAHCSAFSLVTLQFCLPIIKCQLKIHSAHTSIDDILKFKIDLHSISAVEWNLKSIETCHGVQCAWAVAETLENESTMMAAQINFYPIETQLESLKSSITRYNNDSTLPHCTSLFLQPLHVWLWTLIKASCHTIGVGWVKETQHHVRNLCLIILLKCREQSQESCHVR